MNKKNAVALIDDLILATKILSEKIFDRNKLIKPRDSGLVSIESAIIEGVWDGENYDIIAKYIGLSKRYVSNYGGEFWELLTVALQEIGIDKKVTKKSLKALIEVEHEQIRERLANYKSNYSSTANPITENHISLENKQLELPEGPLAIDSNFYIERPPREQNLIDILSRPGILVRIKASRYMGKTSLLIRGLHRISQHNYQVVSLNFGKTDDEILKDLKRFLRWFCINVGRKLKLSNQIENYWEGVDDLGAKVCCDDYFQEYILEEVDKPIIIALDNLDLFFLHPHVAKEFLSLLRTWHETAKTDDKLKKLGFILVYSTEAYIPLDIRQSPFNVGIPIELKEFNSEQIQQLACLHNLFFQNKEIKKITSMFGGHPHLIRLAFYYMVGENLSLEEILRQAPTQEGIYKEHLRRYEQKLKKQPELVSAIKQVIKETSPAKLADEETFKLLSMGLISLQDDRVIPSCGLYQQYFYNRF